MKLLICEDDSSTIHTIETQLDFDALGIHQILKAYNGVVAKQIIDEELPELILCDIGMPLNNGVEVLKHIHENGIETVFAFLTCYDSFEYEREAANYGADRYLTKPFEISELNDLLVDMIKQYREKTDNDNR